MSGFSDHEIDVLRDYYHRELDKKDAEIERLKRGLEMARRPYNSLWNEIERLRVLLRDALPFINDAGDDEDPEAKTAAIETAESILCALEQARKR